LGITQARWLLSVDFFGQQNGFLKDVYHSKYRAGQRRIRRIDLSEAKRRELLARSRW
jgi:hypothetical protein